MSILLNSASSLIEDFNQIRQEVSNTKKKIFEISENLALAYSDDEDLAKEIEKLSSALEEAQAALNDIEIIVRGYEVKVEEVELVEVEIKVEERENLPLDHLELVHGSIPFETDSSGKNAELEDEFRTKSRRTNLRQTSSTKVRSRSKLKKSSLSSPQPYHSQNTLPRRKNLRFSLAKNVKEELEGTTPKTILPRQKRSRTSVERSYSRAYTLRSSAFNLKGVPKNIKIDSHSIQETSTSESGGDKLQVEEFGLNSYCDSINVELSEQASNFEVQGSKIEFTRGCEKIVNTSPSSAVSSDAEFPDLLSDEDDDDEYKTDDVSSNDSADLSDDEDYDPLYDGKRMKLLTKSRKRKENEKINKSTGGSNPTDCLQCGKNTRTSKSNLKCTCVHTASKSPISTNKSDNRLLKIRRRKPVSRHECPTCGKFFIRSNLARHTRNCMDGVNEGPPWVCRICKKIVGSRQQLIVHTKNHTTEKSFQCTHCGKLFSENRNLNYHMLLHTDEKKYKCDSCPMTFKQPWACQSHMKNMHSNNPSRHQCPICGTLFKQLQTMKRHILKVHEKHRPHKCNQCDKSFKEKGHLNYHLKTHTNPNSKKRGLNRDKDELNLTPRPSQFQNTQIPTTQNNSIQEIEDPIQAHQFRQANANTIIPPNPICPPNVDVHLRNHPSLGNQSSWILPSS